MLRKLKPKIGVQRGAQYIDFAGDCDRRELIHGTVDIHLRARIGFGRQAEHRALDVLNAGGEIRLHRQIRELGLAGVQHYFLDRHGHRRRRLLRRRRDLLGRAFLRSGLGRGRLAARRRRRRRRGLRHGSAAGRRQRHHRRSGTRQHSRHVQGAVRFDDDARVQLARRNLFDVQPVRIVLKVHPGDVQPVPIDEVLAQRIVHRVQPGDAEIAGELQRRFLAPRSAPCPRRSGVRRAASSTCAARCTAAPP